jgi:hypothetical protein
MCHLYLLQVVLRVAGQALAQLEQQQITNQA